MHYVVYDKRTGEAVSNHRSEHAASAAMYRLGYRLYGVRRVK